SNCQVSKSRKMSRFSSSRSSAWAAVAPKRVTTSTNTQSHLLDERLVVECVLIFVSVESLLLHRVEDVFAEGFGCVAVGFRNLHGLVLLRALSHAVALQRLLQLTFHGV